jgi:hypothetical protein
MLIFFFSFLPGVSHSTGQMESQFDSIARRHPQERDTGTRDTHDFSFHSKAPGKTWPRDWDAPGPSRIEIEDSNINEVSNSPEETARITTRRMNGKRKSPPPPSPSPSPPPAAPPSKANKRKATSKGEPPKESVIAIDSSDNTESSSDDALSTIRVTTDNRRPPSSSARRKKNNGPVRQRMEDLDDDESSFDNILPSGPRVHKTTRMKPKPGAGAATISSAQSKSSFNPQPRPTAAGGPQSSSAIDTVGASKFYSGSGAKPKPSRPLSLPISRARIGDDIEESCELVVTGESHTIQRIRGATMDTIMKFRPHIVTLLEVCPGFH